MLSIASLYDHDYLYISGITAIHLLYLDLLM